MPLHVDVLFAFALWLSGAFAFRERCIGASLFFLSVIPIAANITALRQSYCFPKDLSYSLLTKGLISSLAWRALHGEPLRNFGARHLFGAFELGNEGY